MYCIPRVLLSEENGKMPPLATLCAPAKSKDECIHGNVEILAYKYLTYVYVFIFTMGTPGKFEIPLVQKSITKTRNQKESH